MQIAGHFQAQASGIVVAATNGQNAAPEVPPLTAEEIAAREAHVKARKW